jgi:RNA polymerase sigma factor (sigma-70 family)
MNATVELSDETVLAAIQGSRPALEQVAAIMTERIRLMVFARLNPNPTQLVAVEEITQQSVEALIRGLPTLAVQTAAGMRAFASTIVARRVADYLRDPGGVGRGRAAPGSLESTVAGFSTHGPLWRFLSASGTSPLSAAVREDQFRRAMDELGRLRQEYRAVITLAFFDQLSTAQIAEQLGTTRQAASMTLLRAVRALRARMSGVSAVKDESSDGQ